MAERGTGEWLGLSAQQQGHQELFEQHRLRARRLYEAAQASQDVKGFSVAVKPLFEAADALCAQAEAMPARMDEGAHEHSGLIIRAAGVVDVVLALVLLVLTLFTGLGRGWWVAVVFLGIAGAGLLSALVLPPGGAHREQRTPALVSPVLAAAGIVLAVLAVWGVLPGWWWLVAGVLFAGSAIAAGLVFTQDAAGEAPSLGGGAQ